MDNNFNNEVCPNCGCKITPGAPFCETCGAKIGQPAQPVPPQTPNNYAQQTYQTYQQNANNQQGFNPQQYPNNPYNPNNQMPNQQPNSKKLKPVHIILIVIGVLAILLVGILIGIGSNKGNDNLTTTETTTAVSETTTESTTEKTTTTTTKATTKEAKLNGITSHSTFVYSVGDEYGGAAFVMLNFDCSDKDIDGYEVRMTFPYNDDAPETYYVDKEWNAVYYGSQDPSYTVEIRSYKGEKFSKWTKLCDEKTVNSKKPIEMSENKFESTVAKDGYQLK